MEVIVNEPHHYTQRTWIGNIKRGATADAAFELLRRHATPDQGGRRIESADEAVRGGNPFGRANDKTDIPTFGGFSSAPVKHEIFPEHRTVVNTTREGHPLHPGNVHRRIVQEGDDLYVVTDGYGTGLNLPGYKPWARRIWSNVDQNIHDEFNPPSTFDAFMPPHMRPGPDPLGIGDTEKPATDVRPTGTSFAGVGPSRGALTSFGAPLPLPAFARLPWFDRQSRD
jgi:hypothetical protein